MEAAGGEFFWGVEGDISDGNPAAVFVRIAGGNLHFPQGPDVVGDFHDILDLEFLHLAAVFVVSGDFHEGSKFGVDPDIDDFIFAGTAFRFVDTEFITRLAADFLVAFEFRIRPVEEAEGEILVGEIGAGDGLGDFSGREVLRLAVDHLE